MSTWNDVTHYKDQKLQIMKRAQLVIADLWACANASKMETEFTKLWTGDLFSRVFKLLSKLGVLNISIAFEQAPLDFVA